MKERTGKKIFQRIETCEMANPRYKEYTEFTKIQVYIKPCILKGPEFLVKVLEFIPQVIEN